MTVQVDYTRDSLFDELGLKRLKESYMRDEENSPQDRFAYVSTAFSSNPDHAQRLYDYSSKHWLSYSTPILSFGRTKKGLPISCFLNWIDDSAEGLVDTLSETNWLSMLGGGVGIGFGIRSADDRSVGIMPHLKIYDASCLAYKQGSTRRGSYAAYLSIDHPDIETFLEIRKPTGDPNIRAQNLHHGITIPDSFMEIIEQCMLTPNYNDSWELKDPHSREVRKVVSAKSLWQKIIDLRMHTGEPYLQFIDTCNNQLPYFLKKRGLEIKQSNLCLTGDTIISVKTSRDSTPEDIRLDNFIDKFELGYYFNPLVKTYKDGGVIWATVSAAALTGRTDELYEIETPQGKIIRCTPDHKIYTKNRGFVEAKNLLDTDELLEL